MQGENVKILAHTPQRVLFFDVCSTFFYYLESTMLFYIHLLLMHLALCELFNDLAAPFLLPQPQSLPEPLVTFPPLSNNASVPLSARASCRAPKRPCGTKCCYDPSTSWCYADHGLCPIDMFCCVTGCCPRDFGTICFGAMDGVEGPWCWPKGVPYRKYQIPASALVSARMAEATDTMGANSSVLSEAATVPDEAEIDVNLSQKKGGTAGGHGGGGHSSGSRPASRPNGANGGTAHHSAAARPAIPRLFRTIVLLKFAVADRASPTNPKLMRDEIEVNLSEKTDIEPHNSAHGGGHGGGGHSHHGGGSGGGNNTRSAAARPQIPRLFSLLLYLSPSIALHLSPRHPTLPMQALEPISASHTLDKRASCHPPKMQCGSGCYNANNSTCCYISGWQATGICAWGYECCAGFCCDEGWTCHQGKPESESMCWPPGYTSTLVARATGGAGKAKDKARDDEFVAGAVGGGCAHVRGNQGESGNREGICPLGPCWDSIASAIKTAGVSVAVFVAFVGLVQTCVS
jgi:uncharacterized membrane protein YgcG